MKISLARGSYIDPQVLYYKRCLGTSKTDCYLLETANVFPHAVQAVARSLSGHTSTKPNGP